MTSASIIRWANAETSLGTILVAASDRGICRLAFAELADVLPILFPHSAIVADNGSIANWVEGAVAAVENPAHMPDLPLDINIRGTSFQRSVWQELRRIPAGETRSYADIAAAVGKPKATRAVGTANGANAIAVLIPCHRVIRSDGTLGGYAYGLNRKAKLLEREGARLNSI